MSTRLKVIHGEIEFNIVKMSYCKCLIGPYLIALKRV